MDLKMTKKQTITYVLLALACGIAYPMGRAIMIRQEPFGFLIVSDFTLNYIFLFMLAGAISPWIASRLSFLRRFRKATASGIVMVTLVCILLIVLTLIGMPMRWSE